MMAYSLHGHVCVWAVLFNFRIKEIEAKEGRLYNWKDVTEEFIEASNDLELGDLLHDSS